MITYMCFLWSGNTNNDTCEENQKEKVGENNMKRKPRIISCIVLVMVISVASCLSLDYLKLKYEEALNGYSEALEMAKTNKAFNEMSAFCEENQKEIELFSKSYLTMKHSDMSRRELRDLQQQIADNLDCLWLLEKISYIYTDTINEGQDEAVVYNYKSFSKYFYGDEIKEFGYRGHYEDLVFTENIRIVYMESKGEWEEFEVDYRIDRVKKINEHISLYVTSYDYT